MKTGSGSKAGWNDFDPHPILPVTINPKDGLQGKSKQAAPMQQVNDTSANIYILHTT
jgi:hypothetical protein